MINQENFEETGICGDFDVNNEQTCKGDRRIIVPFWLRYEVNVFLRHTFLPHDMLLTCHVPKGNGINQLSSETPQNTSQK